MDGRQGDGAVKRTAEEPAVGATDAKAARTDAAQDAPGQRLAKRKVAVSLATAAPATRGSR